MWAVGRVGSFEGLRPREGVLFYSTGYSRLCRPGYLVDDGNDDDGAFEQETAISLCELEVR